MGRSELSREERQKQDLAHLTVAAKRSNRIRQRVMPFL